MNLWQSKLDYSLSKIDSDIAIIKSHFPRCVAVERAPVDLDRRGVDYIATLTGGAKIFVDVKTREKGASRYWNHGEPELALEVYSVVEHKKVGWALSTASPVDYILYTFDRADTDKSYMIPFQTLRKVFFENARDWQTRYKVKYQSSDSWHSSAIFVPATVVLGAIRQAMCVDRRHYE